VLLLDLLDGGLDHGVDLLGGVGVLAIGASCQPLHEVEARPHAVQGEGVAVEKVEEVGGVAVGGQLVGDELRVDEDTKDIG